MKDNTGLSLGYRILWRFEYIGVSVFGPAQGLASGDPKHRLRLERAKKVKAAHDARRTQAPQEVLDLIERGGALPNPNARPTIK